MIIEMYVFFDRADTTWENLIEDGTEKIIQNDNQKAIQNLMANEKKQSGHSFANLVPIASS